MHLFRLFQKSNASPTEEWDALQADFFAKRTTASDPAIAQMLTMDAPAMFCDALVALSKKTLKKKVISPAVIEDYVELLLCNRVCVHNGFILHDLIELFQHPSVTYDRKKELGVLLEKRDGFGLAHEREAYWTAQLLALLLGRDAYPWLVRLVHSEQTVEVRASAVKSLARVSGQRFDRGLPKKCSKWKAEDLRLTEIDEWVSAGCPDGEGYPPPVLDPALTTPKSDFEKIVFALNQKLKAEQDSSDFSSYDNYLICADSAMLAQLKKRYSLPEGYLEFLTRFSPCNVCITKGMYEIQLYGAEELVKKQVGYAVDAAGAALPDWPNGYLVIADRFGDPYCMDTTGKQSGILFASHGEGVWKFRKKYDSLEAFLQYLAK